MKIIHHYNLCISLVICVLHGITLPVYHQSGFACTTHQNMGISQMSSKYTLLWLSMNTVIWNNAIVLLFCCCHIAIAEVPTSAGCTFMGSSRSVMVHSEHWFYVVCKVCKGDFRFKKYSCCLINWKVRAAMLLISQLQLITQQKKYCIWNKKAVFVSHGDFVYFSSCVYWLITLTLLETKL